MAFRRNEMIEENYQTALNYLIPKHLSMEKRKELEYYIDDLTVELGPVVGHYPSWHPLVCHTENIRSYSTVPNKSCGYEGLDHTLYFVNGFVSCPYQGSENIVSSVENLRSHPAYARYSHVAEITSERIDMPLYHAHTKPVIVRCKWCEGVTLDRTIPKRLAIGLMLESEVPRWRSSEVGETWDTMRPYLLGEPCGKRSSLFLDQEAGLAMKKTYEALAYSGMYGPLMV